jgi:hypothetical protein
MTAANLGLDLTATLLRPLDRLLMDEAYFEVQLPRGRRPGLHAGAREQETFQDAIGDKVRLGQTLQRARCCCSHGRNRAPR